MKAVASVLNELSSWMIAGILPCNWLIVLVIVSNTSKRGCWGNCYVDSGKRNNL